jgi:Short C-terminal domain
MPMNHFGPGFGPGVERGSDGALEELRLRYARGEMTREDYTQRLTDLGGRPAAGSAIATSEPTPPDGA